jgi:hypothetical protein
MMLACNWKLARRRNLLNWRHTMLRNYLPPVLGICLLKGCAPNNFISFKEETVSISSTAPALAPIAYLGGNPNQ